MKLPVYPTQSLAMAAASIWTGRKARVSLPDLSPHLASLEGPSSAGAPQPQTVEVKIDTPQRDYSHQPKRKIHQNCHGIRGWQVCI